VPLLSLIIPTYNRAALLAKTLESVRAQEFTDFELIVVDDGSTDETPAVLARFAEGRPPGKCRVLRQANAGQGAARNLAIDHATGEYCTFLDSDDLLFPWSFSTLARAIEQHGRPPLILSTEFFFDSLDEYAAVIAEPLRSVSYPDLYTFAGTNRLVGPGAVAAKTQLIREAGKFLTDRVVGEDVDLLYRMGTLSPMIKIEAPPTTAYRVHEEQFTANSEKWYRGGCSLARRFKAGIFPGGPARQAEVLKLISRELLFFYFICFYWSRRGIWSSLKLCLRTLHLQVRAGHSLYLVKLPICMALRLVGLWPIRAAHREQRIERNRRNTQLTAVAS